jgi:hypothetical protein
VTARSCAERLAEGSARLYARLLGAYPYTFRASYGREMAQVYRALALAEARRGGVPALVRLWLRCATDLAGAAAIERARGLGAPLSSRPVAVAGFPVHSTLLSPDPWRRHAAIEPVGATYPSSGIPQSVHPWMAGIHLPAVSPWLNAYVWGVHPARAVAVAVVLLTLGVVTAATFVVPDATPPRGVPAAAAALQQPAPVFERGAGGLGLTEAAWRQQPRHGLYPSFVDGRVASVSRPCGSVGCSLQAARAEVAATLLPEDARPLRTSTLPDGTVVDVFASASSAPLWPAEHWRRGGDAAGPVEPGTLSAAYTFAGGYVLGFRVETGEP